MTAEATLAMWNAAEATLAARAILPCCGSRAWADAMAEARPLRDVDHLLTLACVIWQSLPATAWQEAFNSHPRIGERCASAVSAKSAAWSESEQADAQQDTGSAEKLTTVNAAYETRFGRVFLICASGRSAREILAEAERRMKNDEITELRESTEQQQQIMALRLQRWLLEGL